MARDIASNFLTVGIALTLGVATLGAVGCSKSGGSGSGSGDGSSISDSDLTLGENARYGDGNIPVGQEDGALKDIHFDYDATSIVSGDQEVLQRNAKVLAANPDLHAEVEGHCDKRGTNEYNMALGERRAKEVARMLTTLGVKREQLSTVSYGEEIPIARGESEEDLAQNRRAHFAVYRKGAK